MTTPSPRRLVDPVHLFNAMGVSVLTAKHQDELIAALNKKIAGLEREIVRLNLKLNTVGPAEQRLDG